MSSRHADRMLRNGFDDEEDDKPVVALTREQAGLLRANNPMASPWRVIRTQLVVGAVVALLAGWLSGTTQVVWSALYGTATAVIPGALMARGMTRGVAGVSPVASGAGVMFWSLVKIGVSVLMLVLAPRLVQPLSWPALLVALVLCIQVYWFALLWRGR